MQQSRIRALQICTGTMLMQEYKGFGYSPSTKEYKVVGQVYFIPCIGKVIDAETLEPHKYVAITLGSTSMESFRVQYSTPLRIDG